MRSAPLAITVAVVIAACGTTTSTSPTSLVPLVDPDSLPSSTASPTTTVAPSSDPGSPLVALVPDVECGWADALPGGEITFVAGDRLYGSTVDGSIVRCLAVLGADQRGPVRWSPDADAVLLNAATVLDVEGARMSGFDVQNTRVRWTHPTGDALIGPTASNKTLVRREAADAARSEITFLSRTLAAIGHPAGGVVLAAGTSGDGTAGVFAAGEDGVAQPLLTVADPATTITELAADAGGDLVHLLSDTGTSFRVHQLSLVDLTVVEVTSEQEPILDLTAGPVPRTIAWKVGLCNSITDTRVRDDRSGAAVTVGEATPIDGLSVAPIGWLDGARLVVAARPLGCDGPADVWIWNLFDGSATLLVKNVEFPAVRIVGEPARAFRLPSAQPPVL